MPKTNLTSDAGDLPIEPGLDGANTIPIGSDGQVLTADSTKTANMKWTAGGGGVTVIDDLTDVDTTTSAPSLNEVLKWDGSNWVPGTAGDTTEFTFSIDTFSDGISDTSQLIGAGTWQAIAGITFTATYSNAPSGMTATVAMSGSATAWASDLSMVPVTSSDNAEAVDYPSSSGGTITFTLSQSADASTKTDSVTFDNTMRYGTNANGIGAQTDANVEALTEVAGPNESRSQTISNIATGTAGHFLTFAYANRLSDVSQVQMDSGNGFVTASFAAVATTLAPTVQTVNLTAVSNSAGYTEAFKAITSRLADLPNGTNDFKLLTSATALNYIYYGGSTLQTGWTEAQIKALTSLDQSSSNSMLKTFNSVTLGASEYFVIAYPSRITDPSNWFDNSTGFPLSMFSGSPDTLAITNDAGYTEDYDVWASNQILGPGAFQLRTT